MLREKRESQSIIISGESGAGKTESTKHCLQYLAEVVGSETGVDQKILMANPLLEAFGNAKTIRNDNSSRFGKWIEVYFSKSGRIKGAKIINYLLEKSRVIFQDAGERNYHIFYLLCHQAQHFPSLGLASRPWKYLKEADLSNNELEKFNELMTAVDNFAISKDKALAIFEIVAAILHLGEVEFIDEGESCRVARSESVDKVCELLDISPALLSRSLCSRLLDTSKDRIYKSLSCGEAVESAANFAKLLYSKLFDWLVSLVNSQLFDASSDLSAELIGVLDIFGFEIFVHNSFEQFCINYANEKLQQHFNLCIFKLEETVYTAEAIDFKHVEFKDNIPVLELIEKPRLSILMLLNDEIMLPRGSDEALIKKFHSHFGSHEAYSANLRDPNRFLLRHYAGEVTYDIRGFLQKNTDRVSEDLVGLVASSGSQLMKELFGDLKASKKPLAFQFKQQLDQMMARIAGTTCHFVRCIKPNALKTKDKFDAPLVLEQLNCSGIFEAIGIRQSGFPFRLSHLDFVHRYKSFDLKRPISNYKAHCRHLISLGGDSEEFRVGKTMVFYRYPEYRRLELKRNECMRGLVMTTQKNFKRHMAIKLKNSLAQAKPHFEAAIMSESLGTLDAVLAQFDSLTFEMKVARDAKALRSKLVEREEIEGQIRQLRTRNSDTCLDELVNLLHRAQAISFTSRTVEEAKVRLEEAKQKRLVRQMFCKIKQSYVTLEEITETLSQAQLLGLDKDVRR
jgi:myosin heavy subunit